MRKGILIINEQHCILDRQKEILQERYGTIDCLLVPSEGFSFMQLYRLKKILFREMSRGYDIIFLSPIPMLLQDLSYREGLGEGMGEEIKGSIKLFFNERRVKKELPNGRVIYTIPEEGWELI